jgi:hypothetical protein
MHGKVVNVCNACDQATKRLLFWFIKKVMGDLKK